MVKFLILGRSGSGKDTLREILERSYGWKFVKSYTTRTRRPNESGTHTFISYQEYLEIKDSCEIIAETSIDNGGGYKDIYFATYDQFKECDAYIVDVDGMNQIIEKYGHENLLVVYIKPKSYEDCKQHAINRNKSVESFEIRYKDEDTKFSMFEQRLNRNELSFRHVEIENDYTLESLYLWAQYLEDIRQSVNRYDRYIRSNIGN